MANCCCTEIRFVDKNQETLEEFFGKITELMKKNVRTAQVWMGDLGKAYGVVKESADGGNVVDAEDGQYVCTRSQIEDVDLADGVLTLYTDDAWNPHLGVPILLQRKLFPEGELFYSCEEAGEDIFLSNDPEVTEKPFKIEIWEECPGPGKEKYQEEQYYGLTREECTKMLQELLGEEESDFDTLREMFEDEDYGRVREFEYCAPEDFWD